MSKDCYEEMIFKINLEPFSPDLNLIIVTYTSKNDIVEIIELQNKKSKD